ncbi:hypothetical protein HG535_0A02100 [Zygotorulaspora mrakii]|uniref:DUF3074 domain-containing protein n=1 Tax=Zygotorulaspora mrakii TaxID=42260 RepID=A0A7H9AXF9_ZYGMR|nr:uncharacterized protein HG535_0A02100 [Zygotorulaspora mrakii]QLG70272.1 hypothetical protein HG535_0A02100 [Zygotorulaspora mrakii]
MGLKFTQSPVKKEDLPSDKNEIIKFSELMTEDVEKKWKKGKLYKFQGKKDRKFQVQTYSTTKGTDFWLSRVSKHKIDTALYDKVVYYLNGSERTEDNQWSMKDRTKRSKLEKEYIEVLDKVDIIEKLENGWNLVHIEYDLGKPLTIRDFNEWVYPVEPYTNDQGKEVSMIISLNAGHLDKSLTTNHTPAYYVSVEKLEYDYNTNELLWLMVTTNDAGGNVPKWLQNATIAKTVSKDVPFLFDYIESH